MVRARTAFLRATNSVWMVIMPTIDGMALDGHADVTACIVVRLGFFST